MTHRTEYEWQQAVLDAFGAPFESLAVKINYAEKAIACRLIEERQPDMYERLALHDALDALHFLIEQAAKGALQQERKKGAA